MNPMQLFQMLQQSRNPQMMLQQLSRNNPELKRVLEVIQGKSPKEIEQYVRNTAKTQGIDINELAQKIGLRLPQ